MKKIIVISISLSSLLFSASPIHDLMDNRIKGKSYSGQKDDYIASKDGLGIVPLQHYSGTRTINNEIKIQKLLKNVLSKYSDISIIDNVKLNLENQNIGTVEEQQLFSDLTGNNSNNEEFVKPTEGPYIAENGITVKCENLPIDITKKDFVLNDKTYYIAFNFSDLKQLMNNTTYSSICTSHVTSFKELFNPYDGSAVSKELIPSNFDIRSWDTSNVTNMNYTFFKVKVPYSLNMWDTSKVESFLETFGYADIINSNISDWDVSSATKMSYMFNNTTFNGDLSKWDVSNVIRTDFMFYRTNLFNNNSISNWNLSKLELANSMFKDNFYFNQNLNNWQTPNIISYIDFNKNSVLDNSNLPTF